MRIRLRLLFAAAASCAVVIVTVLAYLLLPHVVTHAVPGLSAAEARALVDNTRAGVLWTGGIALLLSLIAAGRVSGWLAGPLARLRESIDRLPERPAAGHAAKVVEIDALAAAAERAGGRLQRRIDRLRAERDELRLLLDAVGEGIAQVNSAGRVVRANPAAEHLLRLPHDATGQPYEAVVRSPALRRLVARTLSEGAAAAEEIAIDERSLFVAVEPVAEPAAAASLAGGVVLTLVDLTEMRRLETVRRDFVANASHELKTPLTSIRGYAETLLDDDVPADARRRFLSTIHANAARLQRIVDDLLDLSRLESGRWTPRLAAVALAPVAAAAWRALEGRAAERGVAFRAAVAPDVHVLGDEGALHQILSNLFDNALRHTPPGGSILVRSRRLAGDDGAVAPRPRAPELLRRPSPQAPAVVAPAGRVAIEVEDTGSGIPRDAVGRIFERFYRVDPARSREEGGTGLGLSIVRHLVESMGGTVDAESELGRGTVVRFVLPAASAPGDGGADAAMREAGDVG